MKAVSEKVKKKSNPFKIYAFNYYIYVFTGFWKYESPVRWKTNLFLFYQFVLALVYGVTMSCFAIDAYLVRKDLQKFAFNMTSSVLVFITFLKIAIIRKKRDGLEGILEQLENNLYIDKIGTNPDDEAILKRKAKEIVITTRIYFSLLAFMYPLRVIADTALDTRSYLIPIPFKDILDSHYELVYAQQVVVILHFLITVIAHDMLIYGIIIRLIAHYEILEKNIRKIKGMYPVRNFEKLVPGYKEVAEDKNLINDVLLGKVNDLQKVQMFIDRHGAKKFGKFNWREDKEIREKKVFDILKDLISHHQNILRQLKTLDNIYSIPLVFQAIGAVLLIGIVILYIIFLSSELTPLLAQQVLYVGTTMTNILYLCSFGSEITHRSQEAANALYDTPWYEMDLKNMKTVFFIIKKLTEAPQLSGAGVVVINRVTYLKFLQNSYNMVAVLKNAY